MQPIPFSSLSNQKGASSLAIVIFLGMAAVILTIAFKLYPVFYEHWQIESVAKSFEEEKDLADLSLREVEKRFQTRLITNNVRDFKFDDNVVIGMDEGLLSIELEYEVRINMYRNIDAVVVFEKLFEKKY